MSRRWFTRPMMLGLVLVFLLPLAARATLYAVGDAPRSWRDADWSSTRLLPPAADVPEARVMVFTGTTGAWKGIFSVHSWLVIKRAGAAEWSRYDVVGWGRPVRMNNWAPDGRWYGNAPVMLADLRGADAERIIPKIERAIGAYPFNQYGDYRIWPGPNSNTFIAAVLRAAPELGVALPPNAVGRDFRDGFYAGLTDSRTGVELNLWGVVALKLGWVEGIEVSLFGLVAGIDLRRPGIKLPGYGRIGFATDAAG
ncbi:MAG: DUF3750 domain-containing protein [Pseudolabrys sp.]